MKYQLVLKVFYSVLSVYILDVLSSWKINFYMSAFDWLRINNKCGFQLAKKFAQREFFKFFKTKENYIRTGEFAAILIFLPSKSLGFTENSIY